MAQSGSAVLYETPYDEEIANLSAALDDTRIYYGDPDQRARMAAREREADTIYEAAAPSAVAKRTIFNASKAGEKNFLGSQELVDDVVSGRVKLETVEEEMLPAEIKAMRLSERQSHIDAQMVKRKTLRAEIDALAVKRQVFIEAKVAREAGQGSDSLDAKIYQCIQQQAAEKNIRYTDGPVY